MKAVIALGFASAESLESLAPLAGLEAMISLTTHIGALPAVASVVLPVATHFETHGTFVNGKGIAQTFQRAVPALGGIEPAWHVIGALGAALGVSLGYARIQDIRAELGAAGGSAHIAEATA
ncbi:MAG: molybdopterin-dependent oxidoreductase [Polyangiaceae bacterium]|nr:molybdopterin-dependent oxidoreductase [Polyangiaceae bacterium]